MCPVQMSDVLSNEYLSLNIKDCIDGSGEMAQSMKCLLSGSLNLIPRIIFFKKGWL